jgi:hypothetical protein
VNGRQLTIRVVLRPFAATMPTMPTTTIAPTIIHIHGTLLVVVLVVVVELLGEVIVPLLFVLLLFAPPVAGPVVVVVVLEPVVPALCASVIAGAMAKKSVKRMRLRRKIGRMYFSPRSGD